MKNKQISILNRMGMRTTFDSIPPVIVSRPKIPRRPIPHHFRIKNIESSRKGKLAERRFLDAWTDAHVFPSWLVSVRKATKKEDNEQKTDAVMTTSSGNTIRIQIKTGKISKIERLRLCSMRIVHLKIDPESTFEQIRLSTIEAIKLYESEIGRKVML